MNYEESENFKVYKRQQFIKIELTQCLNQYGKGDAMCTGHCKVLLQNHFHDQGPSKLSSLRLEADNLKEQQKIIM